ncbi:hypothetical protein IW146_009165 [Coemansia sp. RSA 922]|nr:hypothetical protein IW146_009165 [Coemansia sp. RSA 922]
MELANDPLVMGTALGSLCMDQFSVWIKEFGKFINTGGQPDPRVPIVLTLDNHAAHHAGSNGNKLKELANVNVNVHFLPSNTTYLLQPLDKGIIDKCHNHVNKQLAAYKLTSKKDASLGMVINMIRQV